MTRAVALGLLLALALSACDDGEKASTIGIGVEPDTPEMSDSDADGYLDDEDCDPHDSDVNPGATEFCNGIDDDCNDVVDDGVGGTWYADADEDGFGDEGTSAEACEAPYGYVETGTDCDDADPDAYPSNPELCDGIDNDCDGLTDDGVTTSWYIDTDADGYGDANSPVEGCTRPEGAVADDSDCDDTAADVSPAGTEICDERDNDCDDAVDEGVTATFYADLDGDGFGTESSPQDACSAPSGYASSAGDCDDAAATVYPGASEVCDERDDDCDGSVDEEATATWYADADGDGYGTTSATVEACAQPAGYSADATDCDDTVPTIHPSASESCNGTDDDCDGTSDESDAIDAATWYLDFDGDGYGSSRFTSVACAAPSGYVADDTDCDDAVATTSPAGTELCDDVDNDCDGTADDGVTRHTWYADADGDTWGDADVSLDDCTAPTGYVADDGDCDDTDPATRPDATETCDGLDEDCTGYADDGGVCPCDVDWYDDHPYLFCTSSLDWSSARSSCYANDYHLATVDDASEDAWLTSVVTSSAYASLSDAQWWIGYTDATTEGTWAWEDGSSSAFTHWNPDEPNNLNDEDCAQFYWAEGHWNDGDCAQAVTYICEAD